MTLFMIIMPFATFATQMMMGVLARLSPATGVHAFTRWHPKHRATAAVAAQPALEAMSPRPAQPQAASAA